VIRCKDKQKTGNGIVFVEKKIEKGSKSSGKLTQEM
jgi:hypothetical protein